MGDEQFIDRRSATSDRAWSLGWKAAPGRDFLAHERMAEKIKDRLIEAHRQPGRQLLFYVVMPAEIHVVARIVGRESVVSIVRSCGHILSRWVREVHVLPGPAFASKCRAAPLESPQLLCREIQMLAWRPVRLGLSPRPLLYPHTALRGLGHDKVRQGIEATSLLNLLGDAADEPRRTLDELLRTRPADEAWRAWELSRGLAQPTAQQDYVSSTAMPRLVDAEAATLIAAGGGYGVEGALAVLDAWVCAKIDPAGRLNVATGALGQRVRARALVACLAVEHRLCSAVFVARHYGCTKGTLSVQMARCRTRPQDRKLIDTPLERILSDMTELRAAGLMRSFKGRQ